MDYGNKSKGHSLKYGEEERWKKVAELYGTTKPSRGKKLKQDAGVDDRRPPDNNKALLKKISKNNDDNESSNFTNKKEQNRKSVGLQKKYQSYTHWRSSCYITSLLELLYTNYLHTIPWWSANVGIIPKNTGLKKLYISFTIRDTVNTPGAKNIKSTLNEAREIIRRHVLEEKWEEDNQFGSLTQWFENIISEEKKSITLMSQLCVLGLCMWSCRSGHFKIAPTPIRPLFPINGVEEFNSTFFNNNQNLIGQVSTLFLQRNQLISKIFPDQPCPYNRANLHQCTNREISYEEYIISLPHTLIFEVTQRDGYNYNLSNQLNFPFQLGYQEDGVSMEFMLTARVYSTSSSGQHFYSEVIRSFNDQSGVYKYDDLNDGMAVLESEDLTSLSGCKPRTVLVSYRSNDSDSHSIYSNIRTS